MELETESEEHRSFWTIRISDSEFVPLPDLTSPSQKKKEPRTIIRSVPVSRETSDGLKQLSQTLGVPIKNVLLAGHMKAMAVATGSRDVVSGLVANGRLEVEDGDQVRGLFLNTVPFRLMISEGTWNDLITRTFSAENRVRRPTDGIRSRSFSAMWEPKIFSKQLLQLRALPCNQKPFGIRRYRNSGRR